MKKLVLLIAVIALVAIPLFAQDDMMSPTVEVTEQVVLDGTVTVDYVFSPGPGFIVIHTDNNGAPGPVIGQRLLSPGANYGVSVEIDAASATPVLYAMLHEDTGEMGVYEFGAVEGADGPVIVDGAPVTPPFNVAVINANDQFLTDNTFMAASVTVDAPGFLVIHADNNGAPGPVLGQTAIEAGTTADVAVALEGDVTQTLWPMLHVDTGEAGVYEFGTVEGADGPVILNGRVATVQFWTVPHVRVNDQIVTHGEGMEMMEMAPTVMAKSVLSEGVGFLVIHADNNGAPGPVLGFAPVSAGLNTGVAVELDTEGLTPVLWPMLHVDTGVEGEYEFGTVEGADGPVRVNDQVVTFPIDAAPSIVYNVTDGEGVVTVEQALIDAPGWLVIHIDNNGAPGPVIGQAPLTPGLNTNIVISVDESMQTATVFPMLHYDTGEAGVYEFGSVEGADGPVRVAGAVVTGPAEVMAGE
ncbi:MAG: hypothetical protein OHK0046_02330 [Anaerolineae bacterium]